MSRATGNVHWLGLLPKGHFETNVKNQFIGICWHFTISLFTHFVKLTPYAEGSI
jgi:hypothetical protein